MRMIAGLWSIVLAFVIGAAHGAPQRASNTAPAATVAVDDDDIGGVVTSGKGPEAGVWVIAETTDLPTRFARIVVTDDRGRYLIPDLPKAGYDVWVRGYGLVDSAHVRSAPGRRLDLAATPTSDARAAAHYYPSGYWFSLMQVPPKSDFPGTGANGIDPAMKTQADWLRTLKSGTCWACHALGTQATREIPAALDAMSRAGGLAAADPVRPGRRQHDAGHVVARHGARPGDVRGLVDADREGRGSAGAAAAAGDRALDRDHRMGLGGPEGVSARRGLDRSAQSAAECERPDLRLARAQRRLPAGARSREEQRQPRAADGPRSGDAAHVARNGHAVAHLGQRSRLDQPQQRPQSDARREGARVADVHRPPGAESRLLQGRIGSSVGEAHAGQQCRRVTWPSTIRRRGS